MTRPGRILLGIGCALAATLSARVLAAQDPGVPPAQEAPPDRLDEIVVTPRKGAPLARLDTIGYLQRYCFDANRLTGQSAPPEDDRAWEPLDAQTRARFGIADPAVPAFGLVDETRGHTLVIKFETFTPKRGLSENRCTLVVIGGADHARLPDRITAMFRGRGAQRHVGHPDGSERIAGWRQWLWTAMPSRRSKSWQSVNGTAGGRTSDTWLRVIEDAFYDTYDYVLIDLKTREGSGENLSVVTFAHTTREKRAPGR